MHALINGQTRKSVLPGRLAIETANWWREDVANVIIEHHIFPAPGVLTAEALCYNVLMYLDEAVGPVRHLSS